ncbi:MAG: hypothetical protein DLM69_10760 [Candidatus Chloroheliales bacterium]|nr:MAG: hypothetical protein DLM69_10760 [Chloroflexota bacterium]
MDSLTDDISLAAARQVRGGTLPHVPPPAAPLSTRVRLELVADEDSYPEAVFTDPRREHGWRVALTEGKSPGHWYTEILLPQEPTLLHYHFVLADGTILRERRQNEGVEQPLFGVWQEQDFHIAVYQPASPPPDWVRGQVVYQIFPDRFARGDAENIHKGGNTYQHPTLYLDWDAPPEHPPRGRDFYGGDLRGVIGKLDYLKALGITCIYFTPIFASPTNHRYDALDYLKIDPRLGTEDDLRELIARAGERGIRILLDGVFNHCSKDSIYLTAARADKLSPYYRWFNFSNWPDEWVGWVGVKTMPEFVECPEVEEFFFGNDGVAQHWLSYGIAGWRTDVTPWMSDEFWARFRHAVRRAYPEAYLVAEDWGDATPRLLGTSFDATMNYRFGYSVVGFAAGRLSPAELDDRLETLRRDTPPANFHAQLNLIGSHDTARALTTLGGSAQRLMLAAAFQLAYPGVPMIYYGDEAGSEGSYAEGGRRPYPWGAADERLLDFYKRAINARRQSAALSYGDVRTVWLDERGGYGFVREVDGEMVIALFNSSASPLRAAVALAADALAGQWQDLLGGLPATIATDGVLSVTVPPFGAAWLIAGESRAAG